MDDEEAQTGELGPVLACDVSLAKVLGWGMKGNIHKPLSHVISLLGQSMIAESKATGSPVPR